MKNLFKNLMLVAVAAMAFTACSQDVNEVNNVEKVTRYEFTANIAEETRSGFSEETSTNDEGKTVYHSEWFGDETLKLFVTDYNGYYVETTAKIKAEGQFTLELTDAPDSFFITVVSPAESWVSESTANIPAEQTPLANSVDPKAHLLQAQAKPVSGGVADIDMTHMAAYGKMTVNGVDFKINKVEVSFNGGTTYTINATNVENNTFWFAISENLTVSEFTVTAYGEGDYVVTKTVSMEGKEKPLAFSWGRVSTFSVSGLEVPAEPVFTSATADGSYYTDYYLTFQGENLGTLVLDAYHVLNSNYELPVGSYALAAAPGNFWTEGYSTYTPAGSSSSISITSGTVKVSVVNNEYVIEFIDLVYGSNVLNTTYTGTITGLNLADPRQELPLPSNVKATVSGKTITLSWDAVEHADGYQVMMWNPSDEEKIEVVNGTQYVFEAQKSNTTYNFNVYSYANDDNASYKTSIDWAYVYVTTEDTDPKIVLSKESISFTADGGNDAVDVTLKNIDGDFTYTVDADWLTVTRPDSGASLAVSAPAYDNESEDRSAIITITAGELTKEIPVTQSKKAAEGGNVENATPIDRFVINYLPSYNETEVKFFLNSGAFDVICIDVPGELQSKTYSIAAGNIYRNYCYVQHPTGNEVLTDDMELTVTVNGDGTYTFKGRVKTTTNEYIINCTGTPTIG